MHRYLITTLIAWLLIPPGLATAQELPDPGPYFRTLFAPTTTLHTKPASLAIQVQDAPAPQTPPPLPPHTGFRAFVGEVGSDFASFPRRPSTWVILGVGAGAAALGHLVDDSANRHLTGSDTVRKFFAPGKWIGSVYVQAGTAAGLYLIGRYVVPPVEGTSRTNKFSHLGMDLLRAQILAQTFTQAIKVTVRRDRPTGECCSFPSGHAASSFATASVLERHFGGYRGAWPTLVIASYVAMSRLHDNRHFVSDVVFGSALGVATGWTVVGRHGRSEFALVPTRVPGGFALTFARVQNDRQGADASREPRQP